jgi:hypothetical protein
MVIPENRLYKGLYISGFPTYVHVDVGQVSPTSSIAYGKYLNEVRCGEERFFYVQARDIAGNNMNTNVDSFEASFRGPAG